MFAGFANKKSSHANPHPDLFLSHPFIHPDKPKPGSQEEVLSRGAVVSVPSVRDERSSENTFINTQKAEALVFSDISNESL